VPLFEPLNRFCQLGVEMIHEQSLQIYERAKQLMPGGVNSAARAFGAVGGSPIVFERASGAYLFDVDGQKYIDYIGSWGPMILGHCHPEVVEAVQQAASQGMSFGAPTPRENVLAEQIIDAVDSIEMVRLVNSGTEATMSALRVARGATGREKVVKFAGNYHGHVDSLLVSAGSAAATLGVPNSPGVTQGTAQDTIVLPYNDVDAITELFEKEGEGIAAVILEPIVGNMGTVPASPEFMMAVRKLTQDSGTVMIIDEVMTGFRVAYGGAQSLYGVQPDLTTLGKIVGGGMPLGAFGGRRDLMQHVLPAGKVFQAGTLSGNPGATAAGSTTLRLLKETNPYPQLEATCARLANEMQAAADQQGVEAVTQRVGSMLTLFFNSQSVTDWDGAARSDTARYSKYFWSLIDQGIYMPCSQFEALFVSAAHSEADIQATIQAVRNAMATVTTL
jgi:glutamate-1-semialdehyde 2,1-aminomutase